MHPLWGTEGEHLNWTNVWRKLNDKERWREERKGGNSGDEGVKMSLDEGKLACSLHGLHTTSVKGRLEELKLIKNQKWFGWKSSLEGNSSEGVKERKKLVLVARGKWREEGREEWSHSPCPQIRGQNID